MFWTQPTYANGGPICEGDWIKTFMPRSLVWHHGIVRSVAFISPEIVGLYVVHNMKATGITTTELFGFCEGQPVLLHARPIRRMCQRFWLERIGASENHTICLLRTVSTLLHSRSMEKRRAQL